MVQAAQLVAQIVVEGDSEAKGKLSSFGSFVTSTGTALKAGLGGAMGFLKDQLVDSVKIAMQHQQVMAQTTQAIKSTGDASGLSAKAIDGLADSLSKTTQFSHDAIQSGENLLLTFTGIGKDAFPLATKAMLDLSQATGQDLKSSAIQLGKALNDPLTGMSALQRVGVTFSKTEQDQIKTMMAHNDVLGAQKVMLKELDTEFGGSAQAAGKTFAGALQILKNNLEDVKEKIGAALLPVLNGLMQFVSSSILPLFDKFGGVLHNVGVYLSSFELGSVTYAWNALKKAVEDALKPLQGAGGVMKTLSPVFITLRNDLSQLLVSGIKDIAGIISGIAGAISAASHSGLLTNIFSGVVAAIRQIIGVAGQLSLPINLFQVLSKNAQELGKWFQQSVVPAFNQAKPGFVNLGQAAAQLLPFLKNIADIVHTTLQKAIEALLPVLQKLIPLFIQFAGTLANNIGTTIKALIPVIQTAASVLSNVFLTAWNALMPILNKLIPIVMQLSTSISTALTNAIKFLAPYVVQAMQAVGKFADEIIQRVQPIVMAWFTELQKDLNTFQAVWKAVWPYVSVLLKGVWDTIVAVVQVAWSILSGIVKIGLDVLSGNWKQAWNDLKDMLVGVWEGIKTYLSGAWGVITGLFSAARDTISGIFHGLINNIIGILNSGIDALDGFVSGIANAINGVASALGAGNVISVSLIPHIPAYAQGTDAHPGGPALVGEKGPELVLLPRGSAVLPHPQTMELLKNGLVPSYAGGIGDFLGGIGNWVKDRAGDLVNQIIGSLPKLTLPGPLQDLAGGIVKKIEDVVLTWVKGLLPSAATAGPSTPVNVPGSLMNWIQQAMALAGAPANWLNAIATIAMNESGGDPNAVNNTDINAQEGHPSQGIMQTIPDTFAAYMLPGHGNILNPIDNIIAGIRYIMARYGSVFNVPGIVSMAHGGPYVGYANGTSFAPGGMAIVGEQGPELMYVPHGAQITPANQLRTSLQAPQITVNTPIYLDGKLLANGLLPHIANAIRHGVGTHGY